MRKITIRHSENWAELSSKTGELSEYGIRVSAAENNEVIKKAIDIIRKRFLKTGKALTIEIKPINSQDLKETK